MYSRYINVLFYTTLKLCIMRINSFFLSLLLLMASSCVSSDLVEVKDTVYQVPEDVVVSESSLSFDEAISNLNFIYKRVNDGTKPTRRINKVDLLTTQDIQSSAITRSNEYSDGDVMPLAYVVNFENETGYAVLAANNQLPPVIMIGDNGNFSTDEFINYIHNSNNISTDGLSTAQELQYAMISNSLTFTPPSGGNITPGSGTASDTTMILKCLPLVSTKWGQSMPYNMYAPYDSSNMRSLAGCVPVAYAQTLAALCYHHNFRPQIDICENYPVDWINLNKVISADTIKYYPSQDTPGSRNVARLIRAIGSYLNAEYSHSATGAWPRPFTQRMVDMGCRYANYTGKDTVTLDSLFNMIVSKNYPVTASAYRMIDENNLSGHAFVLDGWLRLEYRYIIYNLLTMEQDYNRSQFDLVHVNFGWNGSCDGYYVPGAFDLSTGEFDEYTEENDAVGTKPYIYKYVVEYLTYDL